LYDACFKDVRFVPLERPYVRHITGISCDANHNVRFDSIFNLIFVGAP
jgi:hypothetical protein